MPVLSRHPSSSGQRREAERAFEEATEALLREGGSYAELSVGQIAERAGKTRTAFYAYFRDKRELLMAVTGEVAQALYDEADRWWSGEGGVADLEVALRNILSTYREHSELLRAVVEASSYDDEVGDFWRALVGRFITATEDRLARDGVEPDRAHGIAFALVWMTERSCYQHIVRGGRLDDDELVASLVHVWRGAIGSD
jgi:TetR/AcrR family transcriptional regulator, ethionamide resistance regulator